MAQERSPSVVVHIAGHPSVLNLDSSNSDTCHGHEQHCGTPITHKHITTMRLTLDMLLVVCPDW